MFSLIEPVMEEVGGESVRMELFYITIGLSVKRFNRL